MRARDLWSSSNRIEENLFTGLQVNTIVMALMWRIDRGDWPYYWICCCCLTKLTHMGERLKSESTLHSRGFSDRCSVNDVYARIILPLLNHYTCGVTPGVTVTRWDPSVWSDVKLSFVVCGARPQASQCITVHISTVTKCGAIFTYLGTISCWGWWLQSILVPASASILCTNHWMPIISA